MKEYRPDRWGLESSASWQARHKTYLPRPSRNFHINSVIDEEKLQGDVSIPSTGFAKSVGIINGLQAIVFATNMLLLHGSGIAIKSSPDCNSDPYALPAQYETTSLLPSEFTYSREVTDTLDFVLDHQLPDGPFITDKESKNITLLDNAHVILALTKVGHLAEAKQAASWFLEHMTQEGDPDEFDEFTVNGIVHQVSYAGSWYDGYTSEGEAKHGGDFGRGRGESVGLFLIALHAIHSQDPDFINQEIQGKPIKKYIEQQVEFLLRLQQENGAFVHKYYYVPFTEENVRDVLGLELGAEMIEDKNLALQARIAADKGREALLIPGVMNNGMAYDLYAMSMWGICGQEMGKAELARLQESGLLRAGGNVRKFNWKENILAFPENIEERLKNIPNASSETTELGIVYLMVGDMAMAVQIEEHMLALQRDDGGFADQYFVPNKFMQQVEKRIPIANFQNENIYTAARELLFFRLLEEARKKGIPIKHIPYNQLPADKNILFIDLSQKRTRPIKKAA